MSISSLSNLSTSDGSERSTNEEDILHENMLTFVYDQRLADRLQHSPIQVWQEFIDKHQGSCDVSIQKKPLELMQIFVEKALPNKLRKRNNLDLEYKSEQSYFRFLKLSLRNWNRNGLTVESSRVTVCRNELMVSKVSV